MYGSGEGGEGGVPCWRTGVAAGECGGETVAVDGRAVDVRRGTHFSMALAFARALFFCLFFFALVAFLLRLPVSERNSERK